MDGPGQVATGGLAVEDLAVVLLVGADVHDLEAVVVRGQGVGVDEVGLVDGGDGDLGGGVVGGALLGRQPRGSQLVIAAVGDLHIGETGGDELPGDAAVVAPAVLAGGEEDDLLLGGDAELAQSLAELVHVEDGAPHGVAGLAVGHAGQGLPDHRDGPLQGALLGGVLAPGVYQDHIVRAHAGLDVLGVHHVFAAEGDRALQVFGGGGLLGASDQDAQAERQGEEQRKDSFHGSRFLSCLAAVFGAALPGKSIR